MKKIKEFLGLILIILGLVLIIYPAVYWFMNDNLTQVQVFKKTWYTLPLSVIFIASGNYLASRIINKLIN